MGLLDFMQTPEGQGLLSAVGSYAANARRGTPVNNLGRGVLGGVMGYQSAQENAMVEEMKRAQLEQYKQAQAAAQRKQTALDALRGQVPEQYRNLFDVSPDPVISQMLPKNPEYKEVGDALLEIGPSGVKPVYTAQPKAPEGMRFGANNELEEIPGYVGMKSKIAAAGRPVSSVTVNQPYEKEFDKKLAELDAKVLDDMRGKATSAKSMLGTVSRLEQLNPSVYSGGGAGAKLATANFLQGMGIELGDPQKVANSQEFDAIASKAVLDSLGGSLGAGTSNADVSFIQKTVPQLGHSAEARQAMMTFMREKAMKQIKSYDDARSYAEKRGSLKGWTQPKAVVRGGRYNGRKVVEYDDGSVDYAD